MKIIIAPTKKMRVERDTFSIKSMPEFLIQAKILAQFLKSRSKSQLKQLWQASNKIIDFSQKQLKQLDLETELTPAIIAFDGIQYQYMAPAVFTQPALDYIQKNLRILSGLYGSLRPFDGINPYRLEMKTKMIDFIKPNLYSFWGQKISDSIFAQDKLVVNLASKEYSRLLSPYLNKNRRMITIDFQERRNDQWRTIAVHAKMARGEMVRFIAENQIKNPIFLHNFHDFNFKFDLTSSSSDHYVFRKGN